MKIEIELTDFYYNQEDESLGEALQEYVKTKVLNAIWLKVEKKVADYLETEIKKKVEENLYKQMNIFISNHIDIGQIKSSKDSSKMVSIADFITEKFEQTNGWSNPNEKIKELAIAYGNEMKKRYDLLFASQLVAKMHETGMLKEDIAKILLEKQ